MTVLLSPFDLLGGGMECVWVQSPSEVGMVIPYECCVDVCSKVGVGSLGILPDVFARMTLWCVHGAIHI